MHIRGEAIRRWGYRAAWPTNVLVTLPREDTEELERQLHEQFGRSPGNHTTFEFDTGAVVMFHDCVINIGTGIQIEDPNGFTVMPKPLSEES